MQSHEKLEALQNSLEAGGADKLRLELVRRARIFKRSWVDMAEGLSTVRSKELFRDWGYNDLHSYCQQELLLTKSTVDKLTGSFQLVQEHAPQVLQRDGVAQPLPSIDAVDYFAKALRTTEPAEPDPEWQPSEEKQGAITELKQAVFDDNKSVAVLRKDFGPVFFGKSDEERQVESLEKTRTTARRLESLLARLAEAELVEEEFIDTMVRQIAQLQEKLDVVIPDAKAALGEAKRKAS